MSTVEPSLRHRRYQLVAALLLLCGAILIGLSLGWSTDSIGRSQWTEEQGQKYQAVSGKLHSLSHSSSHNSTDEQTAAHQKEIEQAQAEYDELRQQLDAARARPQNWAMLMRTTGILLAIAGVMVYFAGSRNVD